jgi:hypothetical protein
MPAQKSRKKKPQPKPPVPPTPPVPAPRPVGHPVFAQPQPTADPTTFRVTHPSDGPAYAKIDQLNKQHLIFPLPFPAPRGGVEPRLTLDEVFGGNTGAIKKITSNGQIVFHAGGDCGSTRGPKTQNEVTDKMVSDFNEAVAKEIPQFCLLLGDIVYSFGEAQYYYDQFYEPYREYSAPVLAVAGNHDGMVAPDVHTASLAAFLRNFCAETFMVTPEAGGLSRTAQIQPGVFFTFEAPFVRILAIYSNTLEDPGVIADKNIGDSQLKYLDAALKRVKAEGFNGALLIADHHPPYTASGARHGWSVDMRNHIDVACAKAGVWPHAFLSGHAHNYQRLTRTRTADGTEIPYIVCGNSGHNAQPLAPQTNPRTNTPGPPVRAPQVIQRAQGNDDQITLENYDAAPGHFGYLRVVVNASQLRIEYHPAGDGTGVKTPDDAVTVDLATRKLTHFNANDHGLPAQARAVRALRTRG